MGRYVLGRVLALVPLVILVMLILFVLLELLPDAASSVGSGSATQEQIERYRERLGLDRPAPERFLDALAGIVRGDLGNSYVTSESVSTVIFRYLPTTLWIAGAAISVAMLVGVPLGTWAARRPHSVVDRAVSGFAALTLAIPPFVLGLALVVLFALTLRWLPATGFVAITDSVTGWFRSLILPGLTLGALPAGELARHTRGVMVEVLDQDYVRTARAKGMLERHVVLKHAAKNAAIPVVTMLGVIIGRVIAGSVTVEFVFGISGIGRLAFQSVQLRDVPMLQGIVLLSAVTVLVVNLLVDLSYPYFNPRLRK